MALEREDGKVFGIDFSKPNRFLKNRSEFFSELQGTATCRKFIVPPALTQIIL
jgi:hypothetical protein